MAKYTLVCEEDMGTDTTLDSAEVHYTFETDSLQDVTEKLFWFLRASGFTYINNIDVANAHFET